MMQAQMGMAGGAAAMGFDAKKAYKQEYESLRITPHHTKGGLDDAEEFLVKQHNATRGA